MTTREDVREAVQARLGDSGGEVWTESELNSLIDLAIKGLYPAFYRRLVAETTAGTGPIQTAPAGVRNLYFLGHKRQTSTRARGVRGWLEGDGEAYLPRVGITGDLLVWGWTDGWDAPATDATTLDLPKAAEEVLVLRTCVAALETLLTDRVKKEGFHAIQVRESSSEQDIDLLISNLRDSIEERVRNAVPLPEIQA